MRTGSLLVLPSMQMIAAVLALGVGVPRTFAAQLTIGNGVISAEIATNCTLSSISLVSSGPRQQQRVAEGGWLLELDGVTHSATALRPSLEISQPSSSEVLCTWKAEPSDPALAGALVPTFTVSYSAQPGRGFVQKALNASCSNHCNVGRVTPISGLQVGEAGTDMSQFSLDAGGVFIRQNATTAGLMVVVQNKHMQLNAANENSGSKLKWTTHKNMGYKCTASEYKGTVDPHVWHDNSTAPGCLADAIQMGQGINYATTPGPANCYLCSVTDALTKLHALPGQTTFVGTDPSSSNKTADSTISLSYAAGLAAHPMTVPSPFQADLALFTPYKQTPETVPWPTSAGGTGLQLAEYECFWKTADAFMLQRRAFKPMSTHTPTVKMHVPWTANFLEEVDTSRPENLEQAKRVIQRCSEIGVNHILWSARDSRVVTHEQSTDNWSWGASLWLTLGEKMVSGEWLPSSSKAVLPPSLTSLLDFATSKNVSLCPYVYPSLGMGRGLKGSEAWLFGSGATHCDKIPCSKGVSSRLANREYQDFLIEELLAFIEKTGSMGMGFDYTFINDPEASMYSQWAGWRRILSTVLSKGPDGLQVDNRQQNHEWGPWMWVATGSYAEPLQSDEQPESWIAFTPDLHTARLTANRMREMNFDYRMNKLCPAATAPGFFSHQSDMLNITGARAWNSNRFIRDFDIFGYKFALLSSIGTAGLNSIVNTLPARDADEFDKFPQEDLKFIRDWLAWTDSHRGLLRGQRPLPIAPGHGKVDGSYAFHGSFGTPCSESTAEQHDHIGLHHGVADGCPGFVFLYNPNGKALTPEPITLGPTVGIDCSTMPGETAHIVEVYPQNRSLEMIKCGATWSPGTLAGKSAMVVRITFENVNDDQKETLINTPAVLGLEGAAQFDSNTGKLELTAVRGERGTTQRVKVLGATGVQSVTVNGFSGTDFVHNSVAASTEVIVRFGGGTAFNQSQEVSGSWDASRRSFTGNFAVPSWVFSQLRARNTSYPIAWEENDLSASWLSPGRLLLFLEAAVSTEPVNGLPRVTQGSYTPPTTPISLTIDGDAVATLKSYNCRGLHRANCFSGFYWDLTDIKPDATHSLQLKLGANFTATRDGGDSTIDLGLFFDNVEAELTDEVVFL